MQSSAQKDNQNEINFIKNEDKKGKRKRDSNNPCTLTKEIDGILRIPTAGSIFSSSKKATSGRNHAQVTWTHKDSTSVGFKAPPIEAVFSYKKEFRTT